MIKTIGYGTNGHKLRIRRARELGLRRKADDTISDSELAQLLAVLEYAEKRRATGKPIMNGIPRKWVIATCVCNRVYNRWLVGSRLPDCPTKGRTCNPTGWLELPPPQQCNHEGALEWPGLLWCRDCGAVNPADACDVPENEWTLPNVFKVPIYT